MSDGISPDSDVRASDALCCATSPADPRLLIFALRPGKPVLACEGKSPAHVCDLRLVHVIRADEPARHVLLFQDTQSPCEALRK
jgi:hypothetical protein